MPSTFPIFAFDEIGVVAGDSDTGANHSTKNMPTSAVSTIGTAVTTAIGGY